MRTFFERGSTAQKSTARIAISQHFLKKYQKLDRKISTVQHENYAVCVQYFIFEHLTKYL